MLPILWKKLVCRSSAWPRTETCGGNKTNLALRYSNLHCLSLWRALDAPWKGKPALCLSLLRPVQLLTLPQSAARPLPKVSRTHAKSREKAHRRHKSTIRSSRLDDRLEILWSVCKSSCLHKKIDRHKYAAAPSSGPQPRKPAPGKSVCTVKFLLIFLHSRHANANWCQLFWLSSTLHLLFNNHACREFTLSFVVYNSTKWNNLRKVLCLSGLRDSYPTFLRL